MPQPSADSGAPSSRPDAPGATGAVDATPAPTSHELAAQVARLESDLGRWRSGAVRDWASAVAAEPGSPYGMSLREARSEVEAMRRSVSWRVTAPLRGMRRATAGGVLGLPRRAVRKVRRMVGL